LNQAYSLEQVKEANETAGFNRWAQIEVVTASAGEAEIRIGWREEFGQYAGFLHAGSILLCAAKGGRNGRRPTAAEQRSVRTPDLSGFKQFGRPRASEPPAV